MASSRPTSRFPPSRGGLRGGGRVSRLRRAAGRDRRPRQSDPSRADADRHQLPQRAPVRTGLHQSLGRSCDQSHGRRRRRAGQSEHPGAGARNRARGRRVIDVADADLFESRRRGGHHSGCRLQSRRDADATGVRRDRHPPRNGHPARRIGHRRSRRRDSGIPTLAQLAGAMADAGILAVRYDKRGFGQSGGRSESATISDYAEDVRAVVRWLEQRKDVDPKRIAVVGHSEGAWVGCWPPRARRRSPPSCRLPGHRRPAPSSFWSSSNVVRPGSAHCRRRAREGSRASEADSCCGADRQGLGRLFHRSVARGRHTLVPESADLRSGEGHQRRASAAALRSRRARPTGPSGARRTALRPGAQGEQLQVGRGGRRPRREPPARARP